MTSVQFYGAARPDVGRRAVVAPLADIAPFIFASPRLRNLAGVLNEQLRVQAELGALASSAAAAMPAPCEERAGSGSFTPTAFSVKSQL